ncbi:hypothetical protein AVEN_50390-1, partial [Araneus ventricosus]
FTYTHPTGKAPSWLQVRGYTVVVLYSQCLPKGHAEYLVEKPTDQEAGSRFPWDFSNCENELTLTEDDPYLIIEGQTVASDS